jgi:hypothetical protein
MSGARGERRSVLLEGRYEEWCERAGERTSSARGKRRKGDRRERGKKKDEQKGVAREKERCGGEEYLPVGQFWG